jgi:hypothetical protein
MLSIGTNLSAFLSELEARLGGMLSPVYNFSYLVYEVAVSWLKLSLYLLPFPQKLCPRRSNQASFPHWVQSRLS